MKDATHVDFLVGFLVGFLGGVFTGYDFGIGGPARRSLTIPDVFSMVWLTPATTIPVDGWVARVEISVMEV